ncbi:MAG: NAD(P)/FAD-dependent oxidoreductase [bacterium]|nr:NAD(P)/FAD-dependent oxidoreductase [bacterium]
MSETSGKTAVIIGAGPAGLTAAYELANKTDIDVLVLEKSQLMGGIACTVNYKGNRIDIGGHRFFSKSDRVMDWWLDILPLQATKDGEAEISYHRKSRTVGTSEQGPDPDEVDEVMLIRERTSRIYYLRQFFDYPISLSFDTLSKLGLMRTIRIGLSYVKATVFPIRNPKNLEEFFISRFGRELYLTFFKSYTEKVWGTRCTDISAEWGAQRIKGLSITKAVLHFIKQALPKKKSGDISQKGTETSLIEQFLYPKLGPGQMWEVVEKRLREKGAEVRTGFNVTGLVTDGKRVTAVTATSEDGEEHTISGDYFFSTMAVKDLVRGIDQEVPAEVREISEGLIYRDFVTVGLLVNKLKIHDKGEGGEPQLVRDNWIYIQEPDVLVGRLQIFNNWSPYLVADPDKVWIGLEYFCNDTDELWSMADEDLVELAGKELDHIEIIDRADVLDGVVLRVPKTYPAYFGTYDRFDELRAYLDSFENLFLTGRNGMHRYNNQDHSMLTAMVAVENIIEGRTDKSNLWDVNTEDEYLEEKEEE